jgi:hypothetical protein
MGKKSGTTITVEGYSAAYFRVLELVPELKTAFALGDRVIVVGRDVTMIVAPNGATTLSDRDVQSLKGGF